MNGTPCVESLHDGIPDQWKKEQWPEHHRSEPLQEGRCQDGLHVSGGISGGECDVSHSATACRATTASSYA